MARRLAQYVSRRSAASLAAVARPWGFHYRYELVAENVLYVSYTCCESTRVSKYKSEGERASRRWSTVVDIYIPPSSFRPVSLPLS